MAEVVGGTARDEVDGTLSDPIFALVNTTLDPGANLECSSWVYDLLTDQIRLDPSLVRDLDMRADEMGLEEFLPCLAEGHRESFRARLSLAGQGEACVLEGSLHGQGTHPRVARIHFQAIQNPDGPVRFIAGVVAWHNVQAPSAGHITGGPSQPKPGHLDDFTWSISLAEPAVRLPQEWRARLGWGPEATISIHRLRDLAFLEDLPLLDLLQRPGVRYQEIVRFRTTTGEEIALALSGTFDESSFAWSGVLADVSQIVRREAHQRARMGVLAASVASDSEAVLVLRAVPDTGKPRDFEILVASKGSSQLLGISQGDAGKLLTEVAPLTRTSGFLSQAVGVMFTGQEDRVEVRASLAGLREQVIELKLVPIPQGVLVRASDLSADLEQTQRMEMDRRFLQQGLALASEVVLLWDLQTDRAVRESRSLLELLGYGGDRLPDLDCLSGIVHPEDLAHLRQILVERWTSRLDSLVLRLRASEGRYLSFEVVGEPFETRGGEPTQLLLLFRELQVQERLPEEVQERMEKLGQAKDELENRQRQLEELNARLGNLAWTDGLTGLKNHRAFQDRLQEEVARAQRYGLPLSLVLIDIDHFKEFNDRHGHPKGDALLKEFAQLLMSCARTTDFVVRYGGEEFAIILPSTNAEEASCLAERIRALLRESSVREFAVTASYGCAELTAGPEARALLVANADAALYRSKRAGRDRVTVHHPEATNQP